MRIVDNNTYKKALYNKSYINIMNAASKSYIKKMGYERVRDAKNIALWESLRDFEPDKGMVFTTFLYQRVKWACAKEWKSFKNEKRQEAATASFQAMKDEQLSIVLAKTPTNITDLLLSLTESEYKLIYRRYIENKTLKEIGEEEGVTLQAIQQRIDRIRNKMR